GGRSRARRRRTAGTLHLSTRNRSTAGDRVSDRRERIAGDELARRKSRGAVVHREGDSVEQGSGRDRSVYWSRISRTGINTRRVERLSRAGARRSRGAVVPRLWSPTDRNTYRPGYVGASAGRRYCDLGRGRADVEQSIGERTGFEATRDHHPVGRLGHGEPADAERSDQQHACG